MGFMQYVASVPPIQLHMRYAGATQSGTSKVVVSCGQCTTNTACTYSTQLLPSLVQARWWSHEATQSGTSKVVVS
ncbi:hypothetical protein DPMN_025085 [Dreissena polymorpha]|uniref:Uncharacterized protein n=1 Tax=Dreissena polymorpha TaxID=45954 RepID=A0A9D4LQU7_DREPO|nr:hypothetical protein DPMN_025085 [Dreissena polymorpha]